MCRQAGYFDQAAYLARKYSEHDVVVTILIEDSKKYAEALAYIWRLEPEAVSLPSMLPYVGLTPAVRHITTSQDMPQFCWNTVLQTQRRYSSTITQRSSDRRKTLWLSRRSQQHLHRKAQASHLQPCRTLRLFYLFRI